MQLNEIFGWSRAERDEKKRNKAKAAFRQKKQGRERSSQRKKSNNIIDHGPKDDLARPAGRSQSEEWS